MPESLSFRHLANPWTIAIVRTVQSALVIRSAPFLMGDPVRSRCSARLDRLVRSDHMMHQQIIAIRVDVSLPRIVHIRRSVAEPLQRLIVHVGQLDSGLR